MKRSAPKNPFKKETESGTINLYEQLKKYARKCRYSYLSNLQL